ncbi:MAG: hypothetical protein FJ303_27235 [Planctomycetes bacterium]|nr:hypothetical protein [Planctomycetota bacterium]
MRKRDVILYLLLSKQGGLEFEGSGTWSARPFVPPTYAEMQEIIREGRTHRDVSEGARFRARTDEGVNLAAPAAPEVPVVPVFAAPTVDYLQIGQLAVSNTAAVVTVPEPAGYVATVDQPPAFVAPTDPGLKLLAADFPALNLVELIGMSNVNEGG